jgi:hypothetical protein
MPFLFEAGHAVGILNKGQWRNLQRYIKAQFGVTWADSPIPPPPCLSRPPRCGMHCKSHSSGILPPDASDNECNVARGSGATRSLCSRADVAGEKAGIDRQRQLADQVRRDDYPLGIRLGFPPRGCGRIKKFVY